MFHVKHPLQSTGSRTPEENREFTLDESASLRLVRWTSLAVFRRWRMAFHDKASYETVWYMCTRIRAAMNNDEVKELFGIAEVDETYARREGPEASLGKEEPPTKLRRHWRRLPETRRRRRHQPQGQRDLLYDERNSPISAITASSRRSRRAGLSLSSRMRTHPIAIWACRTKWSNHSAREYGRGNVNTNSI